VNKSFQHRGLQALYEKGETRRLPQQHITKLRDILVTLDHSRNPADMNLPGFQLHPLKGTLRGYYAVSVSGNWRVTFRFEDGHAVDINYTDYH
jgi:proteic killer suppression protein